LTSTKREINKKCGETAAYEKMINRIERVRDKKRGTDQRPKALIDSDRVVYKGDQSENPK